ncbi:MAG: hypothetical protein E6K23_07485 [Gammaproteobacteria bacterium]|nr:MAG: hypothetical protein E6K40_07430 [Gammaproteobacteria bacterium]TLZ00230.1 MAG: hypothetical protein E6K36_13290 [Gammaproteobacteria bacterium]TLZ41294.1 MAG: hypothetical protein E6K23_07485 [Gammaproteobacteria bacterium]
MKNWILALLAALCAAVGVATLRAAAQSVMTGPRTPPGLGTAAPAPAAPSPASAIHDATVAPDKRQSADNNVSFPIDI